MKNTFEDVGSRGDTKRHIAARTARRRASTSCLIFLPVDLYLHLQHSYTPFFAGINRLSTRMSGNNHTSNCLGAERSSVRIYSHHDNLFYPRSRILRPQVMLDSHARLPQTQVPQKYLKEDNMPPGPATPEEAQRLSSLGHLVINRLDVNAMQL